MFKDFKNSFKITILFCLATASFLIIKNFENIRVVLHIHCILWESCSGEKVKTKNKNLELKKGELNLLSNSGSTRATAYNYLNKIVELEEGFGVLWLDNEENKFRLK